MTNTNQNFYVIDVNECTINNVSFEEVIELDKDLVNDYYFDAERKAIVRTFDNQVSRPAENEAEAKQVLAKIAFCQLDDNAEGFTSKQEAMDFIEEMIDYYERNGEAENVEKCQSMLNELQ